MRIRQRNNGEWCMTHNGVEAPYVVDAGPPILPRRFTIYALTDSDENELLAHGVTAGVCEAVALCHFNEGKP